MATHSTSMIPGPGVQRRYSVTGRTLNRWKHDPDLGFPEPIVINGRDYYEEHALEAWERQRAAASRKTSRRPQPTILPEPAVAPQKKAAPRRLRKRSVATAEQHQPAT